MIEENCSSHQLGLHKPTIYRRHRTIRDEFVIRNIHNLPLRGVDELLFGHMA